MYCPETIPPSSDTNFIWPAVDALVLTSQRPVLCCCIPDGEMGITVSPPAAASGSLASYHLESVKLFSSKEESRFLNPEKKNVKDPLHYVALLNPAM